MSLAPELKKLTIDPAELLLDPNNPRLFTQEEKKVPLERIQDPGFQEETRVKLWGTSDRFRIKDIIQSIERNGYVPEAGGYIFVRRVPGSKYCLVLEGNRRLIAIRTLIGEREALAQKKPAILKTLNPIEVLEIVDDIPEGQLQEKISYLLGTCHHGSHKDWSPFAQARTIYKRYLALASQDERSFRYEPNTGREVASLLCTKEKEVKERLMVYRAMEQLAAVPEVKAKPSGGIIGRYYSLVREAVSSTNAHLRRYIPRNPDTFLLDDAAVQRMIRLCNFDGTEDREVKDGKGGSSPPPMKNPEQWRYLTQILADENEDKRTKNLALVEEDLQHPEDVWARRFAELREFTWKRWLEQVYGVLKDVGMGEDLSTKAAKAAVRDTQSVVASLERQAGGDNA
jgi:hypothetical protein